MTTGGSAVLEPLPEELLASPELAAPSAASCVLAPRYEAVRVARDFARTTLRHWGMSELYDRVALVASELVTNALRHGLQLGCPTAPATVAVPPEQDAQIRISLVRQDFGLVCEVRDPSSAGPAPKLSDHITESGRGLHLVASFSDSWGWRPLVGAGKVVWAVLRSPDDATP